MSQVQSSTVSHNSSSSQSLSSQSSPVHHQGRAFKLTDESQHWGMGVWDLVLDLKDEKVNKLDQGVLEEFETLLPILESLGKEGKIEALVLRSGKSNNFIAGADIKLIQSADTPEKAKELCQIGHSYFCRWEDLPFPTVAAIDGSAMGGGCELSLASTAILMSSSPKSFIGLPEVLLGLIPGLGGCVRLPQRIGIANSLDMILTGKTHKGDKAFKIGLADACIKKENFNVTVHQWVIKNLKKLKAKARNKNHVLGRGPKLGGMGGMMGSALEGNPFGRSVVFSKATEGVMSKTKGQYPAALEAIEVLKSTGSRYGVKWSRERRQKAIDREIQGFVKASQTSVSKNLINLFFATEDVKKSKGLEPGQSAEAIEIHSAAVLGAGVMGGGVAQLFAAKDINTRMKDISLDGLDIGSKTASKLFSKQLKRRKLTKRQFVQKINRITPVLGFEGFQSLEFVLEAIVEDMKIKKNVLSDLENHVDGKCVIATNTSSLSVSEMQTALKHPERFCGMHFFNPVHRMPLIEVIRGEKSSDESVTTVYEFSKKLGKTPIVVKDAPGFLVNRLLAPYLNEAAYLLGDGAPIAEIDHALVKFGMPMGPIELIDEVGVDVGAKVVKVLHEAFGDRMPPAPLIGKVVETKRLGKKNLKGFYEYEQKGSHLKKTLNPNIYGLVDAKPQPKKIAPELMVERSLYPMVNEAVRCLDEKVVMKAQDVDLGMIMGTGFAPFRGGLLRWADSVGIEKIHDKLVELHGSLGERFKPSEGLIERAKAKRKFYESE